MSVLSHYPALSRVHSLPGRFGSAAQDKRKMAFDVNPKMYFTAESWRAVLKEAAHADEQAAEFLSILAGEVHELSREADRLERRGNTLCRLFGLTLGLLVGFGVYQLHAYLS